MSLSVQMISETYLLEQSNMRSQSNIFIHMHIMITELIDLLTVCSITSICSIEVTTRKSMIVNWNKSKQLMTCQKYFSGLALSQYASVISRQIKRKIIIDPIKIYRVSLSFCASLFRMSTRYTKVRHTQTMQGRKILRTIQFWFFFQNTSSIAFTNSVSLTASLS